MIMADVWMWFLLILGIMLVFVSHWMATEALFAPFVARARTQYHRPIRLTFIGLGLFAPAVVIAVVLLNRNNPAVKLFGAILLAMPILVGLAGSAGLSQKVGLGLPSPHDTLQPWRRVLRGGIVLVLTFLLPVFGWFVVLPWTVITGFAAAILSLPRASAGEPVHTSAAPASLVNEMAR